MYQQMTIVGNVGQEPEMKYTPQGVALAELSVAVNKKWGKGDQRQEKTWWFRVTVWRELADLVMQYVHKGSKIMVVGEIDINAYINRDGKAAASIELTGQKVVFLDSKQDSAGGQQQSQQPPDDRSGGNVEDPNDIPF